MCYIFGCLEGVWKVSGRCLSDSGYCLGGCDVQETNKHQIRLTFTSLFLFVTVASDWSKCAIFWGVCRVSGRCLGGIWGLSEWLWILSGGVWCRLIW